MSPKPSSTARSTELTGSELRKSQRLGPTDQACDFGLHEEISQADEWGPRHRIQGKTSRMLQGGWGRDPGI